MSVTDLFLAELTPVANGQVSKDLGAKYENLIRGLSHIKIKVRMSFHTWLSNVLNSTTGLAAGSVRGRRRVHGALVQVVCQLAWAPQGRFCRDFDFAVASYRKGMMTT